MPPYSLYVEMKARLHDRFIGQYASGHAFHSRSNLEQSSDLARAKRRSVHRTEALDDLPLYCGGDRAVASIHFFDGTDAPGLTKAVLFTIKSRYTPDPLKLRTQTLNVRG